MQLILDHNTVQSIDIQHVAHEPNAPKTGCLLHVETLAIPDGVQDGQVHNLASTTRARGLGDKLSVRG